MTQILGKEDFFEQYGNPPSSDSEFQEEDALDMKTQKQFDQNWGQSEKRVS